MNQIDARFLERILRRKLGADVRVAACERGDGMEVGENYGSSTARFAVTVEGPDGRRETLRLFAKSPTTVEAHRAFTDKYAIFEREAVVYNELLPAMDKMAARRGASVALGPPRPVCYYASGEGGGGSDDGSGDSRPSSLILLEDLSASGFRMGDRKIGLGVKETEIVMQAFARFHAHSLALKESSGLSDEDFKASFGILGGADLLSSPSIKPLFAQQSSAQLIVAAVEEKLALSGKLDSEDAELISRLKAYAGQDNFTGRIDAVLEKPTALRIFILGDCWVNNMMFRYESVDGNEEEAVEVRLLDFQAVRFMSAMMDVANFWYLSTNPDVFSRVEDFLQTYYDEFFRCLEELGSKTLSREGFPFESWVDEYCRVEEFGFLMSLCGLPVVVMSKEDFPEDYGKGFAEDFPALVRAGLNGPRGQSVMKRFLGHARRAVEKRIV